MKRTTFKTANDTKIITITVMAVCEMLQKVNL